MIVTPRTTKRFWSFVHPPDPVTDCMLWMGARLKYWGYGRMNIDGKCIYAHRYAWLLGGGKLTKNRNVVRHTCDVTNCVNWDHLRAGTTQQNTKDRDAKARNAFGERSAPAKLTAVQVAAIRLLAKEGVPFSQKDVARIYGVAPNTISLVIRGISWRHQLPNWKPPVGPK